MSVNTLIEQVQNINQKLKDFRNFKSPKLQIIRFGNLKIPDKK